MIKIIVHDVIELAKDCFYFTVWLGFGFSLFVILAYILK